MVLFCATIRKDSVLLLRFPFLSHVKVFSCENSLVCRLKCPYSCFSSHFCFLVIIIILMLVLSLLFLIAVISLPQHFLCSLVVAASIHRHYLEYWYILFLLFLIHIDFLCYLPGLRPNESWFFLFPGPFVEVLPSPTSRMVRSIFREGQPNWLKNASNCSSDSTKRHW